MNKKGYMLIIMSFMLLFNNSLVFADEKINSEKNITVEKTNKGVGSTFAEVFPDPVFAQLLATELSNGDVNSIITQKIVNDKKRIYFREEGITDIRGIGVFTNLESIILDENKITVVPEEVGNLIKLYSISLEENQIDTLPENIGSLSKLRTLHLQYNKLSSVPESISQLKLLTQLFLNENEFTVYPESVNYIQSLESIALSENKIVSLPNSISELKNLEYLHLSNNQIVSLPDSIGDLPKLYSLNLFNNNIKVLPDSIGNLENLVNLQIYNNEIDKLPESISNMKKLHTLHISDNNLTSLPDSFGNLDDLMALYLDNNKFIEFPNVVLDNARLEYLSLNNNKISEIPDNIDQIVGLYTLLLNNNPLGELPDSICNLTNLHNLYVSNTGLKKLPENIGNLKKMYRLFVNDNELTYLPDSIGEFERNIGVFDASNNQLTSIPNMTNLDIINRFSLGGNMLPKDYVDELHSKWDAGDSGINPSPVQRPLVVDKNAKVITINEITEYQNIDLHSQVKLSDGDNVSSNHNLILENIVDVNNQPVDINNYFKDGKVSKDISVYAQVRATGTGMFENSSENAVTSNKIKIDFRIKRNSLIFDLNGGEGQAIQTQQVIENELATKVIDPKRNGYEFIGWNTVIDGSGLTWDFETTLMPNTDVTLYAQWKEVVINKEVSIDNATEANNNTMDNNESVETKVISLPQTGNDTNVYVLVMIMLLSLGYSINKIRNN